VVVPRECPACGGELSREPSCEGLCAGCLLDLALDREALTHSTESAGRTATMAAVGLDAPSRGAEAADVRDVQTSPPVDQAAGALLGRYEIRGTIGEGGMGVVFGAYDPLLGREVAIKVMRRQLGAEKNHLISLSQEAKAASALSHPNIVTVFDLGEHEGHAFIVMEVVKGESLHQRLDEPLPVDVIVRLGTQMADALAAAHEAGIVHRDIKPGNILIDERDNVRLVDFGVAELRLEPAVAQDPEGSRSILGHAADAPIPLVGTLGYIAPEVLRGSRADHRSDQFAFGVVMYEMATGRSLFLRETGSGTAAATLSEDPEPLADRRPDLPAPVVQIIERCLAKEPDERYERTPDILADFRVVAAGSPLRQRRAVLPRPLTSLHGREMELLQLQDLLCERRERLVVLTGVGGCGKTRLAIEAAHALQAAYPGGVVFVPLAAIREPELVIPAVARAVRGAVHVDGEETVDVISALEAVGGEFLLVLDNFEQVVEAAPRVGELLAACPKLSVLATSRDVLHHSGERNLPVQPLEVPRPDGGMTAADVAKVPSVALLVERIRSRNQSFELVDENAQVVAELCRRLDGLPLALELAAARLRVMTPETMLARLESRLALLRGGARDLPERHQSLQAAMDWSYELLDRSARTVLRRLAVFAGGFTLEAAEAVVDPFERLDRPVLECLEVLLDQSLLVREEATATEPRWSMLETVHGYAQSLAERNEDLAALRRAHAAYFLVLAQDAQAGFGTESSTEWLESVAAERANFRAALHWAIAEDEGEWGLRLATALWPYWEIGEGTKEGFDHLAELLALPSTQTVSELRAHACLCQSALALCLGETNLDGYERERMALWGKLGSAVGVASSLNNLGAVALMAGQFERARVCFETCLELWERAGSDDGRARALSNLACLLRLTGEPERALQLFRESEAMFERLGDPVCAAWEVSHQGDAARDLDDPQAESLFRQALERFRRLEDSWGVASTLVELSEFASADGDVERCARILDEALAIFRGLGHLRGVAGVLERFSYLAARGRDDQRALLIGGATWALRQRVGYGGPQRQASAERLERALVEVRLRVGAEASADLWRRGSELPLSRIVAQLAPSDQV
jgi:predicted ATPase